MTKIKRKKRKFHDSVWKNSHSNYYDVSMIGHGCGVSNYLQFYDKNEKKFKCYRNYI